MICFYDKQNRIMDVLQATQIWNAQALNVEQWMALIAGDYVTEGGKPVPCLLRGTLAVIQHGVERRHAVQTVTMVQQPHEVEERRIVLHAHAEIAPQLVRERAALPNGPNTAHTPLVIALPSAWSKAQSLFR